MWNRAIKSDSLDTLNDQEIDLMVSQNAIPSRKHLGGYNPYVFTEQGVAMLATVLNSERAIQVNIEIMRTFVRLRQMLAQMQNLPVSSTPLKRNTTHSSKWSSMRYDNSWLHPINQSGRSVFRGIIIKQRQSRRHVDNQSPKVNSQASPVCVYQVRDGNVSLSKKFESIRSQHEADIVQ